MKFIFDNGRFEVKVTKNEISSGFSISMQDRNTDHANHESYPDYEAVEERFYSTVSDILNKGIIPAFANVVEPELFKFDSEDMGLSSNPSLSFDNSVGLFYIVFEKAIDDFGGSFHAGFIATNNNNGGEEVTFDNLKDAENHIASHYGIKPHDDKEYRNFKRFVEVYGEHGSNGKV